MKTTIEKNRKIVITAVFSVIIIILQFMAYMIPTVGGVSFSVVLVPVVLGAAMYGPVCGAFLGGVFGLVTTAACIIGIDPGGAVLLVANPAVTVILCFVKGILAGLVSGLLFKVISPKSGIAAIIISSIAAPVVNTGVFCLGMSLFYIDTLRSWAGGTDVLVYVFTGLIGLNFVVEVLLNVVLCPVIARSLKLYGKNK